MLFFFLGGGRRAAILTQHSACIVWQLNIHHLLQIASSSLFCGADISMNGQRLEEVTSFKDLGATLCKDGTRSAEVHIRIASAMAAMVRLNRIWRCNTISFTSKFKLYKSLLTSILLYGCETWILIADSEKKDPGFWNQVPEETSPHLLLTTQDQQLNADQDQVFRGSTGIFSGKRWKLAWFGHVACHDSLSKTILQGTLVGW